ncbi:isochorismate synthase [Bacillus sp. DJP31]|uniref:isochorismate synthase n=1 Tax=Bacillus sp. DJP31 TaxID=3409789 RepID=UPI003BB5C5E4
MVTIQQSSIKDDIVDGINKAKQQGQPILISSTIRIDPIDPILFYTAGKELFFGERFFWKEPHQHITYVGLGAAQIIETMDSNEGRFDQVKKKWDSLLQSSIRNKNSRRTKIGPLLFGGFSFDPTKKRTDLWRSFPESKFYLPKYMLTIENDQTWFTMNVLVTSFDLPEKVYQKLEKRRKELLGKGNTELSLSMQHTFTEQEVEVDEWMKSVETVISQINQGKFEKAVLAREIRLYSDEDFNVASILLNLVQNQPSSYVFAIESDSATFIGSTPERLIKKEEDRLFSTCLAGSIKRGKTEKEDKDLERTLLADSKNLEEHQFVVQMITEELSQVCSSVTKPIRPSIFKAKNIQHLYTPIVGKAHNGLHLLSIVKRLHPTPALGGFPQDKAMVAIREHELLDRGWYAGPIGWIDSEGNGEFAVAIRSGLIQKNEAALFAGCGIVGKSEPEKEYEETQIKLKPMLTAIGGKAYE